MHSIVNRVVILQHPNEKQHPKGTVSLLSQCISRCHILRGEVFVREQLHLTAGERLVLVYPNQAASDSLASMPCGKAERIVLVLIDGTWRKSRKLLHLNPWLLLLPRLSLSEKESRYVIRKARGAHQLSTFEAAVYALEQIEPKVNTPSLLACFENFLQSFKDFPLPPAKTPPTDHPLSQNI